MHETRARVAVVGLGRIGLPTAVACARARHDVVGIDRDETLLDAVRRGELPFDEPGVTDLPDLELRSSVDGVSADVFILCIGTNSDGRLTGTSVVALASGLPSNSLVIIESTVPPGTCETIAARGARFVAHCPERARPGDVFDDLVATPRLIGGVTSEATRRAVDFYRTLTDAELVGCSARESELAKLAENAAREVRIAFANELADLARELGLEPARVTDLANSHPRTEILRSGVGVGGTCLPIATRYFAERTDGVAAAARALHCRRPVRLARNVAEALPPGAAVCVLGRTYRANTRYDLQEDGTDPYGSPAMELIAALRREGLSVTRFDPADADGDLDRALAGVDGVVVAVRHDEFGDLQTELPVFQFA